MKTQTPEAAVADPRGWIAKRPGQPDSSTPALHRQESPRIQRHAESIHAGGPRVIGELIAEIISKHPDVAARVEAYAALDPAIVRAIGADRFVTPFASIDGGRAP
jgi:hypothetical protein